MYCTSHYYEFIFLSSDVVEGGVFLNEFGKARTRFGHNLETILVHLVYLLLVLLIYAVPLDVEKVGDDEEEGHPSLELLLVQALNNIPLRNFHLETLLFLLAKSGG